MPTSRPAERDRRRRRRRSPAPVVAGLLLVSAGLAGCGAGGGQQVAAAPSDAAAAGAGTPSDQGRAGRGARGEGRGGGRGGAAVPPPQGSPGPSGNAGSAAEQVPVPSDLPAALGQVLTARATALTVRDREAFLAGIADEPGISTREAGYFDNLAQLPIATLGYRLLPASLVRTGEEYWGVVEVTLQLAGYDDLPVRTLDRFRFGREGGRYVVTETTDAGWELANVPVQQPWDTEPVVVREGLGTLGVFDAASLPQQRLLVDSVERGLADVSARVPWEWSRSAVFYVLSDPRFLQSFDNLPGGDPQALDGVAFTVPAGTDEATVAATRFALSPDVLPDRVRTGRDGRPVAAPALDRLVRHELVHLASTTHDDGAPLWISEGVAEWVAARALAPEQRRVPRAALAEAADRQLRMPDDASFNGSDAEAHYALAWWVCEWLAATYGDEVPFEFMDAFGTLRDREGAGDERVVQQVLGMSVDQLARRGARLMLQTYGSGRPDGRPDRRPDRGPDRRAGARSASTPSP